MASEKRLSRRFVSKTLTRVMLNGRAIPCQLVNVSAGGAVIDVDLHVPVGTGVILDIPGGGPVTGSVVRVAPSYTALAFEEMIVLPADL